MMSERQFEKMLKHVKELEQENEQLRELLKKCLPYVAGWSQAPELFKKVQKEVGDE